MIQPNGSPEEIQSNEYCTSELKLKCFSVDKGHNFTGKFRDPNWNSLLYYLVDTFAHINVLNTSLQGPDTIAVSLNEEIQAFGTKLDLWSLKLKMGRIAAFPKLGGVLEDIDYI